MKIHFFLGTIFLLYFSSIYYEGDHKEYYGVEFPNGTWNGLIGRLLSKQIDIILLIHSTKNRIDFIDFSIPVSSIPYILYVKPPKFKSEIDFLNYFNPFPTSLWIFISIIIGFIFIGFLIIRKYHRTRDLIPIEIYTFFLGMEMERNILSLILLYLTFSFLLLIIWSSYSGTLLSIFATQKANLPFYDIDGLLKMKMPFRVRMNRQDGRFETFKTSANPMVIEFYRRFLNNVTDWPKDDIEGMKKACEYDDYGYEVNGGVGIYIANKILKCNIEVIDLFPTTRYNERQGLAFRKNEHYTPIINAYLLRMREFGVSMRPAYLRFPSYLSFDNGQYLPLNWKNILPLCTFLIFGHFFSLIILCIERKLFKRNK